MKFSGKIGNWPVNKRLTFGGDPDYRLDTGIVFRIRHCWEIRKVVNAHSFTLIPQMAALVRRVLAEVCTVPVLLVDNDSRQFTHVIAHVQVPTLSLYSCVCLEPRPFND